MAQGAGNIANGQLVKGSGTGTHEWREDFVLTDTDGVTPLFKIAKADGAATIQGVTSISTNLSLSGTLAVAGASTLSAGVALAGIETGLTAHSGGGQGSALALSATKTVHNVTTVAAGNDSVALPAATGSGAVHVVMNSAAANSCQVYGAGTDTINGVATATGVALAAGKAGLYVDYAAGTWFELKGA